VLEDLDTKLERVFSRIRKKATERERKRKKGNASWNPKLADRVLIKSQNQSDAAKGVIDKFMHVYQGPYIINKILPHSTYEIVDNKVKLRGEFNRRHLKPQRSENN
jgi:dsDNA-specific endonuclease/ATPase MutS2